ncbi:MAG: septation protein SpoVG [Deltaproteobacteria bacterium CG_4_10_14_0_2_um_filter_43_8]|nr:MAG: septation protein SpoVG [Deltaproteobacteria bacterium CG11_big_fil_rev_8_21_14_0_20_42_23]PJA21066.1 MAG: septation protein SpoVG [Deltaproteobacteria bacterium CG_4_10_14_0_2_um_filter_43_8]PJC64703.1 MAG: septation protein SpoVG [Deltaproteobacteria bacterium CG_4_9_14_0_2_um_filter_42_21]
MQITKVQVFPVQEDAVKAYVTVTFEDCLVIRDLKIIEKKDRLFVSMPSRKRRDGSYRDTVHPINDELRSYLTQSILKAYYDEKR